MSPSKVLFIVGPTSTGKTSLALKLAQSLGGDLISADSRQVYRGLDILTGKDIPAGFTYSNGHYTDGKTKIYGLDLVDVREPWNAGLFQSYAQKTIAEIAATSRLPIVVGGTGFYLQTLLENILPVTAPADPLFRAKLETETLENLQQQLKHADPVRYSNLNQSDINNKRRLIRSLEIAFYRKLHPRTSDTKPLSTRYDSLVIGLYTALDQLTTRIQKRVTARLAQDLSPELHLLEKLPTNQSPVTTLGYKELSAYMEGQLAKDELIDLWTTKERQYAKRQLTWFKKRTGITWYDIAIDGFQNQVAAQVSGWYSQSQ